MIILSHPFCKNMRCILKQTLPMCSLVSFWLQSSRTLVSRALVPITVEIFKLNIIMKIRIEYMPVSKAPELPYNQECALALNEGKRNIDIRFQIKMKDYLLVSFRNEQGTKLDSRRALLHRCTHLCGHVMPIYKSYSETRVNKHVDEYFLYKVLRWNLLFLDLKEDMEICISV